MREFVLFSRLGRTDTNWVNLRDAGRLDIAVECAVAAFFLSHAIRKNVVFHAILNGPPSPPLHLRINGETLHDVRTDQQTWQQILKKVLSGKQHPGISLAKTSFETILKAKAGISQIYVLEEHGTDITKVEMGDKPVFVLGDHVGLPKKAETFALRYGEKISLGKHTYLAASCITILNYLLDKKSNLY
ncbi:tRNA (pseudouridine(54)-N(1))-methyltransferase TrmY [Candidatus Bathyarchaeota archaeon]|nr:tRNA (pseudouridine(54)-N(1))-methyltransferase TrmY [Candidatus Bathyarchaeota archaeon]